jgi:hypothetical protein
MQTISLPVLLCLCAAVILTNAQRCTTTDSLNVRSCASTSCSIVTTLSPGTAVTLANVASRNANGHTWVSIGNNQWVARTFLRCDSPAAYPPPPPSGGGGSIASFPTSYSTSGYTYTGRSAQVLHFLKSRFGASATTYASHSDGATMSADLWTPGAAFGKNNAGIASMNSLADYCAANLGQLGLKYVIWRQRINLGRGWSNMADRGSLTQNHMDHVHITFNGGARAVADQPTQVTAQPTQTSESSLPGWAVALIVLNAIVLVGLVALVVVFVRVKSTLYA